MKKKMFRARYVDGKHPDMYIPADLESEAYLLAYTTDAGDIEVTPAYGAKFIYENGKEEFLPILDSVDEIKGRPIKVELTINPEILAKWVVDCTEVVQGKGLR